MNDQIKSILADMLNVSKEANPKKFRTEGKTTWKKFIDKNYGENPNLEKILEDYGSYFYDQKNSKEISLEDLKEMYNDTEKINFWVYDRYNDGSYIIYEIYGDENSKYGGFEIEANEILDL